MKRWIALQCGNDTESFMADQPNAFLLLCQIAMRARWKDCPITGMKAGQAYIGDWRQAGIHSEMAYRHAKEVLAKLHLAAFTGTNKGTVATLLNSTIFSYSKPHNNDQGTTEERTSDHQQTLVNAAIDDPTEPNNNGQATDKERTRNDQTTDKERLTTQIHGHTDTREERGSAKNSIRRKKDQTTTTDTQSTLDLPMTEQERGSRPLPFPSDEFKAAWHDWKQHRKEQKNAVTPTSEKLAFTALTKMGEAIAIASINHSIASGWMGIHPAPQARSAPPPPPAPRPVSLGRRAPATIETL